MPVVWRGTGDHRRGRRDDDRRVSRCGDSYLVEPDAFGDGCMTYYVGFLTQREESDDEEGGE